MPKKKKSVKTNPSVIPARSVKYVGPRDENQEFFERLQKIAVELIPKELSRKKGYSNRRGVKSRHEGIIAAVPMLLKGKLGGDASANKIYRYLKRHHNEDENQDSLDVGDYEVYFREPNFVCQRDKVTGKEKKVTKSTFERRYTTEYQKKS